MTIAVSLFFDPMWYIADLSGQPNGGGTIDFFSSRNPTQRKPVYQDSGLTAPWTNPILIPLNGQLNQPVYGTSDSSLTADNYYIVVKDKNGNLVWTMDGYFPSGGGGGSGPTPVFQNFKNYIANNGFWHGESNAGPLPLTYTIAPSNHAGFALSPTGYAAQNYQSDIYLSKDTTAATDSITIVPFTPLGAVPFNSYPDVTPTYYLNYTQTNSPLGESVKDIIFPLSRSVKTFEQQTVTFTLWTRSNAGSVTLNSRFLQFFGTGGAGTIYTALTPITMVSGTWTKSVITFNVPSTAGGTLGTAGDDFVAMVIGLPLNDVTTNCDLAKPSFYLGTVNPATDFDTFDEADSIGMLPRTGDLRTSLNTFAPYGWVAMNDMTIGSATSGATGRHNIDTFPLYQLIWNNVSNANAPVTGGRGGSAFADFTGNKPLKLTLTLGRALASAGAGAGLTSRALGATTGGEVNTIASMPAHNHPGSFIPGSASTTVGAFVVRSDGAAANQAVTVASQGGGAADGNMQPTVFYNVFAKL